MSNTECVIFTLASFRKTRYSALDPIGMKGIPSPCQNLVSVGLVPDIPDELIIRSVKNIVQCDGQFDDTQTRSEMAITDF